jgi:hypothetical protein
MALQADRDIAERCGDRRLCAALEDRGADGRRRHLTDAAPSRCPPLVLAPPPGNAAGRISCVSSHCVRCAWKPAASCRRPSLITWNRIAATSPPSGLARSAACARTNRLDASNVPRAPVNADGTPSDPRHPWNVSRATPPPLEFVGQASPYDIDRLVSCRGVGAEADRGSGVEAAR